MDDAPRKYTEKIEIERRTSMEFLSGPSCWGIFSNQYSNETVIYFLEEVGIFLAVGFL